MRSVGFVSVRVKVSARRVEVCGSKGVGEMDVSSGVEIVRYIGR